MYVGPSKIETPVVEMPIGRLEICRLSDGLSFREISCPTSRDDLILGPTMEGSTYHAPQRKLATSGRLYRPAGVMLSELTYNW